jgi:cytoskeletal protein CcmA (bactofilin family)
MPLRRRRDKSKTGKLDEGGVFKPNPPPGGEPTEPEAPAKPAPAKDVSYYEALLADEARAQRGEPRPERSGDSGAAPARTSAAAGQARRAYGQSPRSKQVAQVGKSTSIKGELSGDEDLEIEGRVEGSVRVPEHQITVGEGGTVTADVDGKSVVVVGTISGSVTAGDRVEVLEGGVVHGDIKTVRLVVQDGATINGNVSMVKAGSAQSSTSEPPSTTVKKVEPKRPEEDAGVA